MNEIKSLSPDNAREALGVSRLNIDKQKADELARKAAKSEADMEKATGGFEAMLVRQMLNAMWQTVDSNGILGEESNASAIYRDMFNEALADTISEGRGIGVKDFLRKEFVKVEKKPSK